MKFYELNDPYYALIAAEDKEEAVKLYIQEVAGDAEESADIEEELKQVDYDHALIKVKRAPGENGENLSEEDVLKELSPESSRVILIDGSLL